MKYILVTDEFLEHREEKRQIYNKRGRSDRKFLMDLDAELLEWFNIKKGIWKAHESWMVDGIDEDGYNLDVKFIRKYWNVSREKTLNLIKQRHILSHYLFYEWGKKPNRPLEKDDIVPMQEVGMLDYDVVADNLKKSFKEPDGFYVDVRGLIHARQGTNRELG